MDHDRAVMFNHPVKVDFTRSSHYCVNIMDNKNKVNIKKEDQVLVATEDVTPAGTQSQYEDEILIIVENMSTATKQKMLLKLHTCFNVGNKINLNKEM